jgi:hypothetical protein
VVARIGVRATLVTGMLFGAGGLALFGRLPAAGHYASDVLPGGILVSLGLGLALVPVTIAAVSGLPARDSGLASGVLNTSRLVGGSLGLAVLATVATSRTHAATPVGAGREAALSALTTGFTTAFLLGAALCALGALAAGTLLPGRVPKPAPRPAPAASPTGTPAVDAAGVLGS